MTIPARCGNCRRELLLDQLLEPSEGFRCPFCGYAFAPSYATIAPGVAARILVAHDALIRSLRELQDMIDGRLRHSLLLEIYTDRGVGTQITLQQAHVSGTPPAANGAATDARRTQCESLTRS